MKKTLTKGAKERRQWRHKALFLFFAACATILFLAAGLHNALETTGYTVVSDKLPPEFDGFRIVHISDFHLKAFGDRESELIDAVWEAEPELIVLTGDIMDKRRGSMDQARELLEGISGRVPVYAVAGNHELENEERFRELLDLYELYGVEYLNSCSKEVTKDGASILLYAAGVPKDEFRGLRLTFLKPEATSYNIMLLHYGNRFDKAASFGYDLVLSGHVHGGVVRLPFVGGIIGNNGIFPKYDAGMYRSGESVMVLSRGLGDASLPRFFNRRELVWVTLKCSEGGGGKEDS